ncbi:hypothetical protein D3C71_1946550 [compost metagenome]
MPTRSSLMSLMLRLITACSSCRRRSLTSCGVSSCRLAAGVPGRGLKMKLKELSKRTSSMSFIIFWKSSSVSPGKPTMKSLLMARSGRIARSLRTVLLYSIAV